MKRVLITDTHFGVKNNSITWLNSQQDFIYNQFIPYLKSLSNTDSVKVIHLGDVFDSRSTISTLVATRVVQMIKDISDCADRFIIIGGNHDYYSPSSDSIDSLNLLLKNIRVELYTNEMGIDKKDGDLYVPWYEWINKQTEIQRLIDTGTVSRIYTHADIVNESIPITGYSELWSGHVHTPSMNYTNHIYNMGSCFPLTFADSNSYRGFYVVDDDADEIKFVPNTQSISFWRLYNDGIFDDKIVSQFKPNDYIELYVNQYNLIKDSFNNKIKWFTNKFKNLWVIPQVEQTISESSDSIDIFEGYNIEAICKNMIPENLRAKFEQVIQSTQKSNDSSDN